MTVGIRQIQKELALLGDPVRATSSQRFFKTGPGEYGEGDRFRGIPVPELRKLARKYQHLSLREVEKLLHSRYHEDRLLALFILIRMYLKAGENQKKEIYEFYLRNTGRVNSWDLVDSSAAPIVGDFLANKKRDRLYALARSPSLWERRIAVLATFHFIRGDQFEETFQLAKLLLRDKEDLIHKAVGWMLREIGKRDQAEEEAFLKEHCRKMPRTMLRYAIERFPEAKRRKYLKGNG